jgi:hypothetical protein
MNSSSTFTQQSSQMASVVAAAGQREAVRRERWPRCLCMLVNCDARVLKLVGYSQDVADNRARYNARASRFERFENNVDQTRIASARACKTQDLCT